jgi:hypothetical protein
MCAVAGKVSYGGPWYSKPAEPKKPGEVDNGFDGIVLLIIVICVIATITSGFPFYRDRRKAPKSSAQEALSDIFRMP